MLPIRETVMEDPVSASFPFATDSLSALIRPINPARLGILRTPEEDSVAGQHADIVRPCIASEPAIFLRVKVISQPVINIRQINLIAVRCMLVALNELYCELIPGPLESKQ